MIARKKILRPYSYLSFLLLMVSGCASQTVKFIQPQSGATAECSASGFGIGASFSDSYLNSCIRSYEGRGFVKIDQLTAAQRAELKSHGLMPKD